LKKLKDFNKYTLKKNEDIYSIYSKDILEEKNDAIKQLTFENIYSIESGGLQFISNFLLDSKKLETISKKFFNLKSHKDKSTFLYAKIDIKDENSNKMRFLNDLEDLNFLIRNILKISNEEYLEIISLSIPEKLIKNFNSNLTIDKIKIDKLNNYSNEIFHKVIKEYENIIV